MTKLLIFILPAIYGLFRYQLAIWSTHKQLEAQSTLLTDAALLEKCDVMAQALDIDRVIVGVLNDPSVNGLAAPNGKIYITKGFLIKFHDGAVSADELASVIAHELGHVALGHAKKRMIAYGLQHVLRGFVFVILRRFLPVGVGFVYNLLLGLVNAGLSRSDEYEADAYASALLIKSNIGTSGQKTLFQKLDKLTNSGSRATPMWLMSHPKSSDRIAAIQKNEKAWQR